MKNTRLVVVIFTLFFCFPTNAQILKNIQKQVKDRVERKAVDKVADKAEEKTAKTMDQMLGSESLGFGFGKNKVDAAVVPEKYDFSWKYSMEVQSDNEKAMVLDYFLEPDSEYFGFDIGETKDMFMILDYKNKIMITTFGKGNEKTASASRIPDVSASIGKEQNIEKFQYKRLPDKVIMGFNCKGIEAYNNQYRMIFYYTNEAKVSFTDVFKSRQNQNTPDALKDYFKPGDNPLMITMEMKDLQNNGKITTMRCIALEKNPYTFRKAEYKFM